LRVSLSLSTVEGKMSHYEKLKDEIVEKTSHSLDLDKVKNGFSAIINSRRKLSRVKNLRDIFHLLEERDALHSKNVSCLKRLGEWLDNRDVTHLVDSYENVYVQEEEKVCTCGHSFKS
jgi:hypothetical protein